MIDRRLLARLFALLMAINAFGIQPAFAQTFPKPPDVPAFSNWTPLYKTDNSANVTIDPTVTPPPVVPLTNIPVPSTAGRVTVTATAGPGPDFCKIIADGGTCAEYKLRIHLDCGYFLNDDPMRNFLQFGKSHLHEFCGGGSVNAGSTYKSLRQHALDSMASGTDVIGTGYWRPATWVVNPYSNGKNYALLDDFWIVYYLGEPGKKVMKIRTGERFVFGFDMDSTSPTTQFAWLQTIIDAANAAFIAGGGTGGNRYSLTDPSGHYENQVTYTCVGATPATVYSYVTTAGGDPYNGTCASGAQFYFGIDSGRCTSGQDLWSPGGYKNVIPGVYDRLYSKWTCPYNSYQQVSVRIEGQMTQYGWTDRQRWCLSSDVAYRAKWGFNSTQVPCGMTFHTDWEDGTDHNIFDVAQLQCAGAEGVQGHECFSGQYDATHRLTGDYSNENGVSRSPQITYTSLSHVNEGDAGWREVNMSNPMNSVTGMQMRSENDNMPMPANDNATQLAGAAPVSFDLRRAGR